MTTRKQFSSAVALAIALAVGLTASSANDSNVDANDNLTADRQATSSHKSPASGDATLDETSQFASAFFEDDAFGTNDVSHKVRELQHLIHNRTENGSGLDDSSFQPIANSISLNVDQINDKVQELSVLGDRDEDRLDMLVQLPVGAQTQLASSAIDSL